MGRGLRLSRSLQLLGAALLATASQVSIAAKDDPAAFEAALLEAVFSDHARYLADLAVAHEHGEGVEREPARAAALYCESARLGNVEAMYSLGWMYANGRGLERNDAYAGTLFAMAAFFGHPQADRMRRYTGDYEGAVPDCLQPPPDESPDPGWSAEAYIAALSVQRQHLARLVVNLSADYAISPRLALAIALTESNLDADAVSSKNAMGVMQLIPDTAARFNVRKPFDPEENIRGGLAYLRWLLAYFRGDIALAAAGYNAGERAVDRYRGVPPYAETQAYVARILAFMQRRKHAYDSRVTEPSPVAPALQLVSERGGGS
ncbi:lytic transglycosylase domain-containing protein [Aromatoleum petrolei]|uniref:Transglycosylase SLT domain-containing protein n=1 Tax=Aromatoleum petrolei TaxID=76116 RepID=A0ABX1MU48_9RHOO|nr:lytic transglycosylase domain-containing protein [Aromatoleum petrolei]NMF90760.1 transglycosylase SLT domain-containing protein [Aromatoleum petrolei]QTQ35375.1 Lytic transglycosylase [Aromatoleum petrolei]